MSPILLSLQHFYLPKLQPSSTTHTVSTGLTQVSRERPQLAESQNYLAEGEDRWLSRCTLVITVLFPKICKIIF